MSKKILVIGATGAMGIYLVPELLRKGYQVDALSLDDMTSDHPMLTYIKGDGKDIPFLESLLKNKYDAIVDFLLYYSPEEFSRYDKLYLENTKHYIFLSTYRVYADSQTPITEASPRLLDTETDEAFLNSGDYSIYKAQEEEVLKASGYRNWSIVRPAITYSSNRFQLVTLEANTVVYRMLTGKTVVLPEEAMEKQATMSWAGDLAKMFSAIILNPEAYGEVYTFATAEHHTWREVAEIYREIGNLKYVTVNMEDYLNIIAPGSIGSRQQLTYDRCFNRVVDNSKVLKAAGLKQSDLMPLKDGLKAELAKIRLEDLKHTQPVNDRMDQYLTDQGIL